MSDEGIGQPEAGVNSPAGGPDPTVQSWAEAVAAADWSGQGDVVAFQLDPTLDPAEIARVTGNVPVTAILVIKANFFASARQLKAAAEAGPGAVERLLEHFQGSIMSDELLAWQVQGPDGALIAARGPMSKFIDSEQEASTMEAQETTTEQEQPTEAVTEATAAPAETGEAAEDSEEESAGSETAE